MPEYKLVKLKSGLRCLLVPNKYIDSVNVSIIFRVGSRCEEENVAGISHFLEHMFFKGTKKRPQAKHISEAVDSVGGTMNAFTSYEYTGYYIKVAKQHVGLAVDVLSDMILNSKFEQKEINRERNVVKEEMKMYEDNPLSYIWRLWNGVLYGEHGLGRDIAGTRQALDNIDHRAMVGYRDSYYSVVNGLLVVVGNFSSEAMVKELDKRWARISAGKKSVFAAVSEKQQEPQLVLLTKDIQQANFCVGVRTYPAFHKNHYITQLLSVVLGQGMSSRLFLKVRERNGLAYSINSSVDNYTDVGNLVVKTGTDADKALKALAMILAEMKKITEEKVGAKELNKAKEYWKGNLVLSLEYAESLANMVGIQELLFDKVIEPKAMMKKIDAVTATDIQRVAQDIFQSSKLNLAVIGPYKSSAKFKQILKI